MIRASAVVACILAAGDCVVYAIGSAPQSIFAPGALWIWWLGAAAWMTNAIALAFGMDKP